MARQPAPSIVQSGGAVIWLRYSEWDRPQCSEASELTQLTNQ